MKKLFMLKREKNKFASQYVLKGEDCFSYDDEYPLIVNNQIKIKKIYVIKDGEEEKEMTSFKSLMPRMVRIEFVENDESMKNQPFIMDLYTNLNLEELEKRLKRCKTERDIEDIEKE